MSEQTNFFKTPEFNDYQKQLSALNYAKDGFMRCEGELKDVETAMKEFPNNKKIPESFEYIQKDYAIAKAKYERIKSSFKPLLPPFDT